jgi:hypothetical protein
MSGKENIINVIYDGYVISIDGKTNDIKSI